MMELPVAIDPETRVGLLIDAYPALEDVLISLVPAFARMKDPVVRETVAKFTTLAQAARLGGIPVQAFVRKLREAAGQTSSTPAECSDGSAEPAWVLRGRIGYDLNGDEMLQAGVHPLARVRICVASLKPGEIVRLVTSFQPKLLIEMMREAGLNVHTAQTVSGQHTTLFGKPDSQAGTSR
jgi:hypothetical protein